MRISDWSSDVCSSDLRGWSLRLGWHQFVPCLMRTYHEHSGKPSARIAVAAFSAAAKSWQAEEVRRTEGEREPQCDQRHYREHHDGREGQPRRSEEHTSALQSIMRISYAVFSMKTKKHSKKNTS